MTALLTVPITTAVTALVGPVLQIRRETGLPANVCIQGKFTYGSGGTTATVWVQTSVDGGATWTDIACFQFTTATARSIYNLSSLTPNATAYAPTDGSLAINTAKDGIIGPQYRAKYTTTGTYAGNTVLEVDLATIGMTAF